MAVQVLGVEMVAPDSLTPHPRNPNRGDIDAIAESLTTHGQYRPVVVQQDGVILAGHHVVLAAKQLGWTEVRIERIECDEEAGEKILLADNRIAELGEGLDPEALLEILSNLDDLAGTGYDQTYVDDLVALVNPPDVVGDPDSAPPAPRVATRVKKGQAWRLGPHRLLVGDSTDTERVLAWLGEDRADCVWTDPPYGVDYVGKTTEALTISNDGASDLPTLLGGAFHTVVAAAQPGAPVYVAHADTERIVFEQCARAAGLLIRQNLIWVKNTIVMGRSDYHYRHEPILYGFTPGGDGRLGRGGDRWYGDNAQATTLFYDKPSSNKEHPTMKPVDLVAHMLSNSCRPGGLVFDPFGGSGSTMAAAHVTGRRANLIELDPIYAEVIIERYEALTGDQAIQEEAD